jgi:sulfite reductase (ferredoxin)
VARNVQGYKVPHFQVVVGGQWEENAGSYGMPIVAIPSKRIPEVVERISEFYLKNRAGGELFTNFVKRIGKLKVRELLDDLTQDHPSHDIDPSFYTDWGDPREFTTGDIGKGECAGEVITAFEFALTDSERLVFTAQVALEDGNAEEAGKQAYLAMIKSAKALVQLEYDDITDDPDEVIEEFEERYFDTEIFFDPFAGPKFANYLFAAHKKRGTPFTSETAQHTIGEAQLFIDSVHGCYNRMRGEAVAE